MNEITRIFKELRDWVVSMEQAGRYKRKYAGNILRALEIAEEFVDQQAMPEGKDQALDYLKAHSKEIVLKWAETLPNPPSKNTIRAYTSMIKAAINGHTGNQTNAAGVGGEQTNKSVTHREKPAEEYVRLKSGRTLRVVLPWDMDWDDVQAYLSVLVRHNPDVWVLLEAWAERREKNGGKR